MEAPTPINIGISALLCLTNPTKTREADTKCCKGTHGVLEVNIESVRAPPHLHKDISHIICVDRTQGTSIVFGAQVRIFWRRNDELEILRTCLLRTVHKLVQLTGFPMAPHAVVQT